MVSPDVVHCLAAAAVIGVGEGGLLGAAGGL